MSQNNESGFNEEQLRYDLVDTTGKELKNISSKTALEINEQLFLIEACSDSFTEVSDNLSLIDNSAVKISSTFNIVTNDARENAKRLDIVMQAMQKLEEDFDKVSNLVKMVNSIADQTNLLALNATIEAARAGEHGKGFAVVASEVKELSKTTKQANEDIQSTLGQISESIKSLSTQVNTTTKTISTSVKNVEDSNEEVHIITSETRKFSDIINKNINDFKKLSEQSLNMSTQVSELKTIGDTFTFLLDMMSVSGVFKGAPNPIERLLPLVESSNYHEPNRFSNHYEQETVINDEDVLISATDTKGIITFANKKFYEVAGYQIGDLVGKPHNIIRHSDMPKTAFQDLWQVIDSGQLWCGIVKNKTKQGGFYWVKAMVFPCYQNGKIVGFLSVRKKPSYEEIKSATEAYKRLI